MAAASGRVRAPVGELLCEQPYRFDFFQAVRILESMAREEPGPQSARRGPVGHDQLPGREIVRFRAVPSLSFPAGAIGELTRPSGQAPQGAAPPPQMTVACMGLVGPSGVLPHHYTSLVVQRVREKDHALGDFLDLFNHRAISLFYRAWEKYRFPLAYERSQLAGSGEDLFTWCLYCLVGLGTAGLRRRLEFDDEAFLFYAGHFAHFPRSATALETILADYFALPVRVQQFRGQWLYLSPEDQTCFPSRRGATGSLPASVQQRVAGAERSDAPGSRPSGASLRSAPATQSSAPAGLGKRLGQDVVVGQRVWDVQSKFRVRLGPIGYRQFSGYMPSGDALRPICQLVRSYVGPQFDFDVQPVLRADEVPACRLGNPADPARLGWNTWVRSRPFERDVDDAVFYAEGPCPQAPTTQRPSGRPAPPDPSRPAHAL